MRENTLMKKEEEGCLCVLFHTERERRRQAKRESSGVCSSVSPDMPDVINFFKK
jgi:hypothetical protein